MLTQTPGKLMMSLSLPAIVGMAVIGLYTFMDAVYAGQLIGMEAMGAVAVAYPFTFINSGGASMIGMGSASVLSRAIGAKDQRTIDQVMGNLVVMNLVLSLTVTIVGTVFARPLLALTGAQGQVLDLAESYLRIMLVGSLFVNFAQSSNMVNDRPERRRAADRRVPPRRSQEDLLREAVRSCRRQGAAVAPRSPVAAALEGGSRQRPRAWTCRSNGN